MAPKSISLRRAVGEHEHVAGVGVGVEAAVDQHLAEAGAQQGLGRPGQLGQDQQVAVDRLGDAGPLELDHHRLAAPQPAPVGLGDRGGGDRLGVEGGEHLLDGPAQPGLEQLPDRLRRGRGDLVLEPAQLGHHPGREQVGAGRQDLAELDEHAAALLEGLAQAPGGRGGRGRERLLAGRLAQAEERPEAVLDRAPGDLGVAGQAAAGAADRPRRVGTDTRPRWAWARALGCSMGLPGPRRPAARCGRSAQRPEVERG